MGSNPISHPPNKPRTQVRGFLFGKKPSPSRRLEREAFPKKKAPPPLRGEGRLVEVGLPPRHSCAAAAPAAQTSQLPHLMEFAERAGLLRWECRPAILAPRQRLRRHPPYCRSCTEIANPPPAAVNTFNRVLCDTRFVSMTYACGFSRKCASGASR